MKKYRLQRGIGLLELTLSLVIIAAVILLATRYFQVARDANRVTQAVNMVKDLLESSGKWLAARESYCGSVSNITSGTKACTNPALGVTLVKLVDLGYIPTFYKSNATPSPWNSKLELIATSANSITISIEDMPLTACKELSSRLDRFKYAANSIKCSPADQTPTIFTGEF